MAVLTVIVVAAVFSLLASTAPVHERIALVFYLAQTSILSAAIWDDLADLRQLYELYLFSIIILMAAPRRRAWKLAVVAAPAVLVATGHRIGAL
jgi:hypothetical protein